MKSDSNTAMVYRKTYVERERFVMTNLTNFALFSPNFVRSPSDQEIFLGNGEGFLDPKRLEFAKAQLQTSRDFIIFSGVYEYRESYFFIIRGENDLEVSILASAKLDEDVRQQLLAEIGSYPILMYFICDVVDKTKHEVTYLTVLKTERVTAIIPKKSNFERVNFISSHLTNYDVISPRFVRKPSHTEIFVGNGENVLDQETIQLAKIRLQNDDDFTIFLGVYEYRAAHFFITKDGTDLEVRILTSEFELQEFLQERYLDLNHSINIFA